MSEKRNIRYMQIAEDIISLIKKGAYHPGEKLPSIRELSDTLNVSINTVKEAYWVLENRHFITAIPQSGYYVTENREIPAFANADILNMDLEKFTLCKIYSTIQQEDYSNEGCGLGLATLSRNMWPTEKIQKYSLEALRGYPEAVMDYMLPPGYGPLREQIAAHSISAGDSIAPDDIVITSGCQESLFLALSAITSPGDIVVVESPIYFSLLRLMEYLKLKVLEIPCSPDKGMHLETLEFALNNHPVKAVLTIANFNNPTGSVMSDEGKQKLVEMLRKRDIPLIEDDIYGELYHGKQRPRSCHSFDKTGNVIYCSSFSKTISPGMRIGWIVPGKFREQIDNLKTLVNLGAGSLNQICAALFLQDHSFTRHLKLTRSILRQKMASLRKAVHEYFPEYTECTSPLGGIVLWITLPEEYDTFELYRKCLEHKIMIAPGKLFTLQDRFTNSMRLSAGVWTAAIKEKITKIGEIAGECRIKKKKYPETESLNENII